MALLNKKNNKQNTEDNRNKPTIIDDDAKITYGEKQYKAKDRQPIQVDPPVADMVRNISYAKDMPMYEVVKFAMEAYRDTLSDSEKIIYEMRQGK